jgi:NAD-dependent deacetylase
LIQLSELAPSAGIGYNELSIQDLNGAAMPSSANDELKQLIVDANKVVAFTGAGISTESGIPDFRSPGGIWTKYQPIDFRDFMASEEMRRESWRRKFATDETMRQATTNAGHRALARLHEDGKLTALITQNIDGLHQASGVPDDAVIELHGNSTYATCLDCSARHEIHWAKQVFGCDETIPICTACGGIVKTATISFGQSMPEEPMRRAQEATLDADLFIVLGSSLVVYPAAGFPIMAKENGARLVIINREPTDQDSLADLVINAEIGATMGYVVGVN